MCMHTVQAFEPPPTHMHARTHRHTQTLLLAIELSCNCVLSRLAGLLDYFGTKEASTRGMTYARQAISEAEALLGAAHPLLALAWEALGYNLRSSGQPEVGQYCITAGMTERTHGHAHHGRDSWKLSRLCLRLVHTCAGGSRCASQGLRHARGPSGQNASSNR